MKKKSRPAGHTHPPNLITVADLLAGAVVPVRMHLKVTIRPDLPDGKPEAGTRLSAARLRELALARRLGNRTPQLLAWARRSGENAALLLVDPVAAAARAGLKLSRDDSRALQEQLGPGADVLPPGVELTGLEVKIASPPAPPPPPRPRRPVSKKRGGRRG